MPEKFLTFDFLPTQVIEQWKSLWVFMNYSTDNIIFTITCFTFIFSIVLLFSYVSFFGIILIRIASIKIINFLFRTNLPTSHLKFSIWFKIEGLASKGDPESHYLSPNITIPKDAPIRKIIKNNNTFDHFETLFHRFVPFIIKLINAAIRIIFDMLNLYNLLNNNIYKIFLNISVAILIVFLSIYSTLSLMSHFTINVPHPNYWKYEIFGDERYDENWLDT